MLDSSLQNDPFGRDIMVQAFLYASGELEGTEALSFEHRLGEDQAARDALCQAVVLCQPLGGPLAVRPDPVYRELVRKRLRFGPEKGQGPRKLSGNSVHPVLWGLIGAAAAALITLALQRACFPAIEKHGSGTTSMPERGRNSGGTNGVGEAAPVSPNDVPSLVPDFPNSESLRTPEEVQRKARAEEPRRPTIPPGQRPRPPVRHAVTTH